MININLNIDQGVAIKKNKLINKQIINTPTYYLANYCLIMIVWCLYLIYTRI